MTRRTPVSAPPNLKNAPPPQYHNESAFDWMRRQNEGRAAPKEKADVLLQEHTGHISTKPTIKKEQ